MKIQFGAGQLPIEGFQNYDMDCDVTKPLPFSDASADLVFSDMMLEHVTPQQAWSFIDEVYRILKSGGLIRLVIPDFTRIWRLQNPEWLRVNKGVTGNDGSLKQQMKSVVFAHGHQGLWTSELLKAVMESIGYTDVQICESGESTHPELIGLEQHWKSVGAEVSSSESGCVEGVKA